MVSFSLPLLLLLSDFLPSVIKEELKYMQVTSYKYEFIKLQVHQKTRKTQTIRTQTKQKLWDYRKFKISWRKSSICNKKQTPIRNRLQSSTLDFFKRNYVSSVLPLSLHFSLPPSFHPLLLLSFHHSFLQHFTQLLLCSKHWEYRQGLYLHFLGGERLKTFTGKHIRELQLATSTKKRIQLGYV